MPGFDGTGPLGTGPIGWRRGPCSYLYGYGAPFSPFLGYRWFNPLAWFGWGWRWRRGFGFGWGWRWRRGWGWGWGRGWW